MNPFLVISDKSIRRDWIHKIQETSVDGHPKCTIWFSIGPVGHCDFEGEDAKTALKLLADHPGMEN